jgi:hypothetical protein
MFNYYAHTPVAEPVALLQRLLQHWPLPLQAVPVPCLHWPAWTDVGPQQVLSVPEQVTHVSPPLPQAVFAKAVSQVEVVPVVVPVLLQQPLGQLAFVHSHTPFLHSVPAGQGAHVRPFVPQACVV